MLFIVLWKDYLSNFRKAKYTRTKIDARVSFPISISRSLVEYKLFSIISEIDDIHFSLFNFGNAILSSLLVMF